MPALLPAPIRHDDAQRSARCLREQRHGLPNAAVYGNWFDRLYAWRRDFGWDTSTSTRCPWSSSRFYGPRDDDPSRAHRHVSLRQQQRGPQHPLGRHRPGHVLLPGTMMTAGLAPADDSRQRNERVRIDEFRHPSPFPRARRRDHQIARMPPGKSSARRASGQSKLIRRKCPAPHSPLPRASPRTEQPNCRKA